MASDKVGAVWEADMPSFAGLLESGDFADAEIYRGTRKWKIHKTIVCSQSEYFETMLANNLEGAKTSTVKVDEEEWTEKDVTALLQFLYTGSLDTRPLFQDFGHNTFSALVSVWYIADNFEVPKLLQLVEDNKENYISHSAKAILREIHQQSPEARPKNGGSSRQRHKSNAVATSLPEVQAIITAIGQLFVYSAVRTTDVLFAFRPALLRIVLYNRHLFPLKILHEHYATFAEGWEFLLDQPDSFASPAPIDEDLAGEICQECGIAHSSPETNPTEWTLDVVAWTTDVDDGPARWLCGKCFKVPTLEDWELVREMEKLRDEQNAIDTHMSLVKSRLGERRRPLHEDDS